jgi:DUF438 domain-containing protein
VSEYLNNTAKRKEALKGIIRKLHQGVPMEALRSEFGEIIAQASAADIAAAEREVIEEGLPVAEIQKLCDLHVAVFQDGLENQPEPESQPGHPVFAMRLKNEVIARVLEAMESQNAALNAGERLALEGLRQTAGSLAIVEEQYSFEENLLFPYLEKHGFEGPSKVMWGVHNQIRSQIKQLSDLLSAQAPQAAAVSNAAGLVISQVREMMYKEEKILIPEALSLLTEAEWQEISSESLREGMTGATPAQKAQQPSMQAAPASAVESTAQPNTAPTQPPLARPGQIGLNTGALSAEQIDMMLRRLPVDITFVDENDEVRYFSQTRERIFTRTAAIIGRKVQNCHPPQSVHVVEQILQDFRAGRRDQADFWIQMGPKFVLIRYYAMRDEAGNYRGTLEVTQDAASIRALQGERRILDAA